MPEPSNLDPTPRYGETNEPQNPPNSVLQPAARRGAVWTYVGGIAVVFLIVAAVFAYRATTEGTGDSELDLSEPATIGTAGGSAPREASPGGFDPVPDHDTTREELEFRGAGEQPQGPMPGLGASEPLTELGAMLDGPPRSVAGRRIDVRDVDVESVAGGNTFVIKDGDARVSVVAPGAAPPVRAGQRVDVSGTVEADGGGSARIRATQVTVR